MSKTSPVRILIVDDDRLLTKSLDDTLRKDGYVIVTVNDGQVGIDAFQAAVDDQKPFSVVITDLGMLNVDGNQVASAVKKILPSTPVILLTGWGSWFKTCGNVPQQADFILSKPLESGELRETLAQCLNRIDA